MDPGQKQLLLEARMTRQPLFLTPGAPFSRQSSAEREQPPEEKPASPAAPRQNKEPIPPATSMTGSAANQPASATSSSPRKPTAAAAPPSPPLVPMVTPPSPTKSLLSIRKGELSTSRENSRSDLREAGKEQQQQQPMAAVVEEEEDQFEKENMMSDEELEQEGGSNEGPSGDRAGMRQPPMGSKAKGKEAPSTPVMSELKGDEQQQRHEMDEDDGDDEDEDDHTDKSKGSIPFKFEAGNKGSLASDKPSTANKKRFFTPEEDAAILKNYEAFGKDWEKILQVAKIDRTKDQVRYRFNKLIQKKKLPDDGESSRDGDQPGSEGVQQERPKSPMKRLFSDVASADALGDSGSDLVQAKKQKGGAGDQMQSKRRLFESPGTSSFFTPAPSTASGDDTIQILERKLLQCEEKLKSEIERNVQLEKELRDQEPKLEAIKQEYQAKLAELEQDFINRSKKSVQTLVGLLRHQAIEQKKQSRKAANKNCLRLANTKFVRQGHDFREVWENGYAFQELASRQEALTEKKEELEKVRKGLMKRKPSDKGGKKELELDEESIYQQEEYTKLKLQILKKEESDIGVEMEALERERDLHIREMKRIFNEDQSRFNNHPLLNKRYLLMSLLGKGGFSEVYKAYDVVENVEVACKIHQLNSQWNEEKKANYTKHAVREYKIHKDLNHPRMVRLFDVFEIDQNSFCTVLEYCKGGDLEEYLKLNKTLQEKEARTIIMQIFSGLRYLNTINPPVIHYDLKPGNILFDEETGAKITDFGLAKIHERSGEGLLGSGGAGGGPHGHSEMELTSQGAGTYWYLPPECFEFGGKNPPKISSKVDVWSVGVIFYQILFGKRPFGDDLSQHRILTEKTILGAKQVEFPPKPQVSQEAKDFIRRCLTYNKELRPDVLVVCEDPYLKQKTKTVPPSPSASSSLASGSSTNLDRSFQG